MPNAISPQICHLTQLLSLPTFHLVQSILILLILDIGPERVCSLMNGAFRNFSSYLLSIFRHVGCGSHLLHSVVRLLAFHGRLWRRHIHQHFEVASPSWHVWNSIPRIITRNPISSIRLLSLKFRKSSLLFRYVCVLLWIRKLFLTAYSTIHWCIFKIQLQGTVRFWWARIWPDIVKCQGCVFVSNIMKQKYCTFMSI